MPPRPALLLIDFINTLQFDGGARLAPRALEAARHAEALKRRAIEQSVPVIYVNDSFGDWRGDFSAVVERCEASALGAPLARRLRPQAGDRAILKPRHSAFYGTPLEFLLDELEVDSLVLTGLQAHICVLFSAHDAYLRRYRLWIPGDCVASEHARQQTTALLHAAEVAGADVGPASQDSGFAIAARFEAGNGAGPAANPRRSADARPSISN